MKDARRPVQWILMVLLVGFSVGMGFVWGLAVGRPPRRTLRDIGPAPTYTLTNQLGQTVASSAFRGKVQVVSFLFPYCTTMCPLIAAHLTNFMNDAVEPAGLENRVQLVSFNVDPAGTGPRQMSAFLQEYGWDPHDLRWQYLTGDSSTVRRVVTGGFHVSYQRVSDAHEAQEPTGSPALQQPEVENELATRAHVDYDIEHDDVIEIIGPRGHIRKVYNDGDVVSPQRLLADVRALLPGVAPHAPR